MDTPFDFPSSHIHDQQNAQQLLNLLLGMIGAQSYALFYFTTIIDFTVIGVTPIIPPIPFRLVRASGPLCEIKTNGATVGPTLNIGTNASRNDVFASTVQAGFATAAAETANAISGSVAPVVVPDLTANGLAVQVTSGATGGALTGRIYLVCELLPI